ncbi:MAG: hypothetical protein LYZ69_08760 [Nitrososphaerales archaeon]|nr:hypothetical protein [Nitrososphaerales archaeon]
MASESIAQTVPRERGAASAGYKTWCAVAAFFDGDGSLDVEAHSYTLRWTMSFVDNWPPQLLQIKSFLEGRGIRVSKLKHCGHGGWKIQVSAIESMKKLAQFMLRSGCLVKKKDEIGIMVQYFDGKITGTGVAMFLNEEVRIGKRTGKIRQFHVPYTYHQGKAESLKGVPPGRTTLSAAQKANIVKACTFKGRTMYQLASIYHVSPSTIYRIVCGSRRNTTSAG